VKNIDVQYTCNELNSSVIFLADNICVILSEIAADLPVIGKKIQNDLVNAAVK
jgi:hypothetical protein